ncbi:hemicentin-1-like [Ylistrum balloti]|uniref:hemicentin-1-like n=1 Tax=Ylistrum balloti TaxID=509963 RepID=UPI002905BCFF|nr:hemicentin-1-like [Ylistrum balloti]
MEFMSEFILLIGMLAYSSKRAALSWARVTRVRSRRRTCLSSWSHKCSMGIGRGCMAASPGGGYCCEQVATYPLYMGPSIILLELVTLGESQAKTFLRVHQRQKRAAYDECLKGCFFTELMEFSDYESKREVMVKAKCSKYYCSPLGYCVNSNEDYFHSNSLIVHCVVDGSWGTWSNWGTCSLSCGSGIKTRSRICNNPAPQNDGKYCTDPSTSNGEATCNETPCPIDGSWGTWSNWGTCSLSCGSGIKTRSRICNNPAPQNDGKYCTDPSTSNGEATCNETPCPIDGAWSSWRDWSACSLINNDVIRSRCRKCTNPIPQYGGANCPEKPLNSEQCTLTPDNFKKRCRCRQSRMPVVKNISIAELAAIIDEIKEELTVDKTQTAMATRKKISAPDSRKSSAIIGTLLGVIMMSIPFVFIFTVDLVNAYQYFTVRNRVKPSSARRRRDHTSPIRSMTSSV